MWKRVILRGIVFLGLISFLYTGTLTMAANLLSLDEIEKKIHDSLSNSDSYDLLEKNAVETNEAVEKLIQADKLISAEDFRRAGLAANVFHNNEIANAVRRYQLLLVATILGDHEARKELNFSWDVLFRATGRPIRIGKASLNASLTEDSYEWADPPPEPIRKIFVDPESAKAAAKGGTDNSEVKEIVDADQACRFQDWSKLTGAEMNKIRADDNARFRRIIEIAKNGELKTSADFANAALVCQHGKRFMDYAFAHELCICSILLGGDQAYWLSGASFDRMLLDASYPQSFATQYLGGGGKMSLQTFTTIGINDRMRKAVVKKTLLEAQNRKFD